MCESESERERERERVRERKVEYLILSDYWAIGQKLDFLL